MSCYRIPTAIVIGLSAIALIGSGGCEQASSTMPPPIVSQRTSVEAGGDSLRRAVDLLRRYSEFEPSMVRAQALYQLTNWAETLEAKADWELDPLVARLPPDYREIPAIKGLNEIRFSVEDVDFLLEAVWLKEISRWATQSKPTSEFSAWLDELEKQDPVVAQKLGISERLFDWTVRNIQLDTLLPYPQDAAAPEVKPAAPGTAQAPAPVALKPPPMRGIPGPGYTRLPWQTLMFGHGDAYERARLFILLARQQGIDAVVLAINEPFSPRARPWAVGVLLNQQLYLFDPQLGLPIPNEDGRGIAKLDDLRANPERIRKLDLDESRKYWLDEADLKRIVALMDAAPQALSRRMAEIEVGLVGDHSLVLTTAPTRIAASLQKVGGITLSQIWSVGCEALVYFPARQELVGQSPQLWLSFFEEASGFLQLSPISKGRHLHLMGVLENTSDELGAKGQYLAARTNRDQLEAIGKREDVQKMLNIAKGPRETEEDFQRRIQGVKTVILRAKQNASYWLGLTQYETGNYQAAVEWFKQRTIDVTPPSTWLPGARYNLARSFESLGQIDPACDILFVDESPQQHGNILRARRLKQEK